MYRGLYYPDILSLISHGNDPYKLISTMEFQKGFDSCSFFWASGRNSPDGSSESSLHHAQQHFQIFSDGDIGFDWVFVLRFGPDNHDILTLLKERKTGL